MNLKASFVTFLNKKFPQLSPDLLNNVIADQLLSPFQLKLTPEKITEIQTEIHAYWKLRGWGEKNLTQRFATFGVRKPNNYSACMSYDFHINPDGKLELIEINTNASFLALGLQMYEFLGLKNPVSQFNEQGLVEMFLAEIQLCGRSAPSVSIFDDHPDGQRLYIEFLIYKAIFEKHQVHADIVSLENSKELTKNSLVYNRYTDFMLQEPRSAELQQLYNSKQIELSPNPYEYFMLADKERFLDWNHQTEIEKPSSLLATYDTEIADKEKLWNERKGFFFKPKHSFGSKQAYRGTSISRKTFEEVTGPGFIAQQLSLPSEIEVEYEGQKLMLKYDLRCYAYKDQLQFVVARLYQGQTTNLRTPGGGFAAVVLT